MTAMLVLAAHPIHVMLVAVTGRYVLVALAEMLGSRQTVRGAAGITPLAA